MSWCNSGTVTRQYVYVYIYIIHMHYVYVYIRHEHIRYVTMSIWNKVYLGRLVHIEHLQHTIKSTRYEPTVLNNIRTSVS